MLYASIEAAFDRFLETAADKGINRCTVNSWRSRRKKGKYLTIDKMKEILLENGFIVLRETLVTDGKDRVPDYMRSDAISTKILYGAEGKVQIYESKKLYIEALKDLQRYVSKKWGEDISQKEVYDVTNMSLSKLIECTNNIYLPI